VRRSGYFFQAPVDASMMPKSKSKKLATVAEAPRHPERDHSVFERDHYPELKMEIRQLS
jgi:hypothetical protein